MRNLFALFLVLLLALPASAHSLGPASTSKTFEGGYSVQTWELGAKPHRRQVVAIVDDTGKWETVIARWETAAIPAVAEPVMAELLPELSGNVALAMVYDEDRRLVMFAAGPEDALEKLRALRILPPADEDGADT